MASGINADPGQSLATAAAAKTIQYQYKEEIIPRSITAGQFIVSESSPMFCSVKENKGQPLACLLGSSFTPANDEDTDD